MTPPTRRPTSADVAALAGVSRATVSMVLNGRVEGTVAAATQQRVLEAAEQLGYTRSALAISLKQQHTRTIGLITDEIATSPFAGRMVRAASMEAARNDYMVITVDLSLRDHSVADAARLLAERQVDGLLYATMGRVRVSVPRMPPGLPLVLLNCELADDVPASERFPTVVPDDYRGARRAARRLVETGHQRVVMLSGDDPYLAVAEREAGFRDELERAGVPVRIITTGWQMDDGYRETSRLLAEDQPPTGLFCIRDRVAAGAIHAAACAGLEVPRHLSVIGFDDEDFFAEKLTPPLTTMALPHEQMGQRAMSLLLDRLDPADDGAPGSAGEPEAFPRERLLIDCPLVERESVARPPLD